MSRGNRKVWGCMWKYNKDMNKDLCHEANEAQAEGPFAYMSPFQSPRRGF